MAKSRKGFTLAEVLIALVVIGIIAAITVPLLIQNYQKQAVEKRLLKSYSTFNQAIKLAEARYGDKRDWSVSGGETIYDGDGNASNSIDSWFKTYLSDFITIKTALKTSGAVAYYLNDGSAFMIGGGTDTEGVKSGADVVFFPGGYGGKCTYTEYANGGVCFFAFNFYPSSNTANWKYLYNKGLEPYMFHWDGTRDFLLNNSSYGCNSATKYRQYCTALIAMNGWKIPDDYPFKVRL